MKYFIISSPALLAATFLCRTSRAARPTLRGAGIDLATERGGAHKTISPASDGRDAFEPAPHLDEWKAVDPGRFEWVDVDEVGPGETTCGFLKSPLGWEADANVTFPVVNVCESYRAPEVVDNVYLSHLSITPKDFCVAFAAQQPAPRGNLAIHCGGPGSLSSCLYNAQIMLPDELRGSYNIVAVDQRGMGRSEPTFMVEDCAVQLQDEDGALSAMSLIDEDSVRAASKVYKQRALRCWNHPGFRLDAEQADGSRRTFHFLEYSGTRQLAEDLERFRVLFGSQKLNIYGISYGTVVMGTYATVFPNNVNLMIVSVARDLRIKVALRCVL